MDVDDFAIDSPDSLYRASKIGLHENKQRNLLQEVLRNNIIIYNYNGFLCTLVFIIFFIFIL